MILLERGKTKDSVS